MKNKHNFLKGFTVIELIVVIAIIAVLATIVTANVMTYVTKGKNTAIKANMANLLTHGGLYLTDGNPPPDNYDDFCATGGKAQEFINEIKRVNGNRSVICANSEEEWCVTAYLVPTGVVAKYEDPVFCVDYTGVKKEGIHDSLYCDSYICH
jgi:prepilin-type N-terminal cleavage/methylation domain-containing protein